MEEDCRIGGVVHAKLVDDCENEMLVESTRVKEKVKARRDNDNISAREQREKREKIPVYSA